VIYLNYKLIITISALTMFVLVLSGCITNSTQKETLTIGITKNPGSALVNVAEDQNMFTNNGFNVELKEFTAGKFALQAFLAGDLDMAIVADFPPVLATMQGHEFYVLTQIADTISDSSVIVIDENYTNPKDYFKVKKRKITVSLGGTPEVHFYKFLQYYNIDINDVEIINQKPEDMGVALANGTIDGMDTFEPYIYLANKMIPEKLTVYNIPYEVYSPKYVLVANKVWVDNNPKDVKKFLLTLIESENFIKNHVEDSQKIVSNITKFPLEQTKSIWNKYVFKVELSSQLSKIMTDEAKWAIETGKVQTTTIPDFNKILRSDLVTNARQEN